jgi:hypothetical protein
MSSGDTNNDDDETTFVFVTDAQCGWRKMLLASAYTVLNKADLSLPSDKQCPAIIAPLLVSDVDEARNTRAHFLLTTDRMMQWAQSYMPTSDAVALLSYASHASQCTHESASSSSFVGVPMCCIDACAPANNIMLLRLYGNGHSGYGRTDSTHTVSIYWVKWVHACMVIGNVAEWLDQEVRAYMDANQVHPPLTREHALQMYADAELAHKYTVHTKCVEVFRFMLTHPHFTPIQSL